ncbi:peptidoglycan DD-metalloendopeptidase family protein [Peribacillus alkalitolerans]|uniref:peptidoglycan DD-metalloendopeptidase family protein n=1 Tax=Peribacillus alkalitolerans TaxID=1550385 RepID=UPI0013D7BAD5|nr:peptidoglycan DD-metalloendopeptidase family protein [Peribacillus alkalitolerans]
MLDYGKRILIALIIAACIGLLFLGGSVGHAEEYPIIDQWVWPTDGVITDHYGTREGSHKGIDIAADMDSEIVSVDKGIVSKSYFSNTYGNVVFIEHGDYETVYAHLNKRLVEQGEPIEKGQKIGTMGNTGRSRGVHLHFEVHEKEWTFEKENSLDPLLVLDINHLATKEAIPVHASNSEDKYVTHHVAVGETLWSISKEYGTTIEHLKSLNHLSEDTIYTDQLLIVSDEK